jgi:hypothetical protein
MKPWLISVSRLNLRMTLSTMLKPTQLETSTLTDWPFHLFRYMDEQAFRFNHRKEMNDSDRFRELASRVVGKRLTFAEVTGKVGKKPDTN